jgi:flotillin
MFVSILPELAGAVAEPLSKTEKIVVVGGGNGNGTGASKVTQDVTQVIAQLPTVVESLTGLKLGDLIKSVPALAAAAANGDSQEGKAEIVEALETD